MGEQKKTKDKALYSPIFILIHYYFMSLSILIIYISKSLHMYLEMHNYLLQVAITYWEAKILLIYY